MANRVTNAQTGRVAIMSPGGERRWVDESEVDALLAENHMLLNEEQALKFSEEEKYDDPLRAAMESAAGMMTFGATDYLGDSAEIAKRQEYNPIASGIGEAAGAIGGLLIPGGPLAAAGKAGKAASAAVRGVKGAAPKALHPAAAKLVGKTVQGDPGFLRRAGGAAAQAGVEGAAVGAASGGRQAALDPEMGIIGSAGHIAEKSLEGALWGVGFGAGLAGATRAGEAIFRKAIPQRVQASRELQKRLGAYNSALDDLRVKRGKLSENPYGDLLGLQKKHAKRMRAAKMMGQLTGGKVSQSDDYLNVLTREIDTLKKGRQANVYKKQHLTYTAGVKDLAASLSSSSSGMARGLGWQAMYTTSMPWYVRAIAPTIFGRIIGSMAGAASGKLRGNASFRNFLKKGLWRDAQGFEMAPVNALYKKIGRQLIVPAETVISGAEIGDVVKDMKELDIQLLEMGIQATLPQDLPQDAVDLHTLHQLRAHAYLLENAPGRPINTGPYSETKYIVGDEERVEYSQKARVAMAPMSVPQDFSNGTMTAAKSDAWFAVWPEQAKQFSDFVDSVARMSVEMGRKFNSLEQRQLSYITGKKNHVGMFDHKLAGMLQGNFEKKPQKQKSSGKPMDIGSGFETPMQGMG